MNASERCLTLQLDSAGPFVAGSIIRGQIQINVRDAQDDDVENVFIKFRGGVHTRIRRSNGQNTTTYHDAIPLIRDDVPVWQKGTAFPATGTDVLTFPIALELPAVLPPSFYVSAYNCRGSCLYQVEVHGTRPGIFKARRKLRMAITVLPSDDFGAQLRQTLILNQDQPPRMRPHYTSDFIRTGLFGEKSKVECTLLLPDTVSLPAFTPVPFRLEIMTTTKLMDNDEPKDKTCIFPSPPAWLGIEWYCKGYSHIYVNKHWRSLENHPDTEHPLKTVGDTVRQFPFEPVWMPETADQKAASKGKGRWKQQVQFAGQFSLNVTPTFTTTILSTDYAIKLKVPFQGIGNKLEIKVPLVITSGVSVSMPAEGPQLLPTYDQGLPPFVFLFSRTSSCIRAQVDFYRAYFGADNDFADEKS